MDNENKDSDSNTDGAAHEDEDVDVDVSGFRGWCLLLVLGDKEDEEDRVELDEENEEVVVAVGE